MDFIHRVGAKKNNAARTCHFTTNALNVSESHSLLSTAAHAASWIHRRMAQMGPGRTLSYVKGEISPKVLPVTHVGTGIPQVGRPRLPPAPARPHTTEEEDTYCVMHLTPSG
jgi:hypothetical protein